nr:PDR/VanB family oxidoreductase [Mycolicibacterium xanthum]
MALPGGDTANALSMRLSTICSAAPGTADAGSLAGAATSMRTSDSSASGRHWSARQRATSARSISSGVIPASAAEHQEPIDDALQPQRLLPGRDKGVAGRVGIDIHEIGGAVQTQPQCRQRCAQLTQPSGDRAAGAGRPCDAASSQRVATFLFSLRRPCSLCGDPAERHRYRIAVHRSPQSRGGSAWLSTAARPGMSVGVSGPDNHFVLEPAHEDLFPAGGIGIRPIRAMIESLPAHRHWRLVYIGSGRSSMAFSDELERRWPANVWVHARDEYGVRPDLARILASTTAAVYCCGPSSMTEAVRALVRPAQLHVERFVPAVRPESTPRRPFHVICRRSGVRVHVPENRSLLDALERANVPVSSSCREGVCGACGIRVLGGGRRTPGLRCEHSAQRRSRHRLPLCLPGAHPHLDARCLIGAPDQKPPAPGNPATRPAVPSSRRSTRVSPHRRSPGTAG